MKAVTLHIGRAQLSTLSSHPSTARLIPVNSSPKDAIVYTFRSPFLCPSSWFQVVPASFHLLSLSYVLTGIHTLPVEVLSVGSFGLSTNFWNPSTATESSGAASANFTCLPKVSLGSAAFNWTINPEITLLLFGPPTVRHDFIRPNQANQKERMFWPHL